MGRIRDLAAFDKMHEDCVEADCFFNNGIIMEITHTYGDAFYRRGYDFKTKKWRIHDEMKPYLDKFGIKQEDFVGCLVETMKKVYGNKGVRPFQEFKCKINDDTFTAFFVLDKRKNRIFNGNDDILSVGIWETLDDGAREKMEMVKAAAMLVEI